MAIDFTFRLNPHWSDLPHCSAVLNGNPRDYHVEAWRTSLAIKSVSSGKARYETPTGRYLIEPDKFLILNHDQVYAMDVEAGWGTETLCPFFQAGLLENVSAVLGGSLESAVETEEVPGGKIELCERLYPKTGAIGNELAALHRGVRSGVATGPWLEDQMFSLAAAVVALTHHVRSEVDGFPGLRHSTRSELYRRLHRARDFMSSCYDEPLTVSAIARAAAMSPFHFQRMFKLAFGSTPMQFLQGRRIDAAQRLLSTTKTEVSVIAQSVGFESLGSFSWLFRQRVGVSPRQFRNGSRERARFIVSRSDSTVR